MKKVETAGRAPIKLQEQFLNRMRREKIWVAVELTSGQRLFGHITGFDNFCVYLKGYGEEEHLIYKHSIAYITPAPEGEKGG